MIGTLELRDRFDDLTVGFRNLGHSCAELASFSPQPVFGSPVQDSSKVGYSWWHVPINVKIMAPWQQLKLSYCTVHLVTPGISALPIDMSWKTRDAATSVNVMTLRHGTTALVLVGRATPPDAGEPQHRRWIPRRLPTPAAIRLESVGEGAF